jgi:hypothetical protein
VLDGERWGIVTQVRVVLARQLFFFLVALEFEFSVSYLLGRRSYGLSHSASQPSTLPFFPPVLEFELRALHLLGRCSTT